MSAARALFNDADSKASAMPTTTMAITGVHILRGDDFVMETAASQSEKENTSRASSSVTKQVASCITRICRNLRSQLDSHQQRLQLKRTLKVDDDDQQQSKKHNQQQYDYSIYDLTDPACACIAQLSSPHSIPIRSISLLQKLDKQVISVLLKAFCSDFQILFN